MTMYAQTYVLLLAVVIGFLTAGIFSENFARVQKISFVPPDMADQKQ